MDSDATVRLPPVKKPKILLVEDEANIAAMVQDWLAETYEVVWANTGKAALEKAAAEQPVLILEDINLPDMTGFDVVKLLGVDAKTSHIPVIFLTGEKMLDDTVKFISTVKNVKGYVNKPFKLKDFLEKVSLILGHKSEFIVLESRPAAPPNQQKADAVREARATDRRAAAEEAAGPKPRIAAPPPLAPTGPQGSHVKKKRGFFSALFSALFLFGLWGLWGLLAAGAASELACRAVDGLFEEWTFIPFMVPTVPAGPSVALPPGAAWENHGVSYRVNSLGLRDEELEVSPSTGTFRVFLLGGSFIFGEDVPLSRTISKRLEALLNEPPVFASAGNTRVVHGALWNLRPWDQWAAYEKLYDRARPDLVLWIVGDPSLRVPSGSRLLWMNTWPPAAREWLGRSRLASLLAMLYVSSGGAADRGPADGALVERMNQFRAAHPATTVMVFNLKKDDPLFHGLAAQGNLIILNINGLGRTDVSWKGLTPAGHEYLARIIHSTLLKYKERLVSQGSPAPAAAVVPKKSPAPRRGKRGHGGG